MTKILKILYSKTSAITFSLNFLSFSLKNTGRKQEKLLKKYVKLVDRALRRTENDARDSAMFGFTFWARVAFYML